MTKPVHNKKIIGWILVPLSVLLATLVLLLISYKGSSSSFDDVDAILHSYRPENFNGLTLEENGSVTLRLEKNDIYWLMEQDGVLDAICKAIHSNPGMRKSQMGFRVADGNVIVFLSARRLGFFPVTYRLNLSAVSEGTLLRLHTEKVTKGTQGEIPFQRWPALFRSDVSYDLAMDEPNGVTDVYLDGNALVIRLAVFSPVEETAFRPNRELLEKIYYFGSDTPVYDGLLAPLLKEKGKAVPCSEVLRLALSAENVSDAVVNLMAWCVEEENKLPATSGLLTENFVRAPLAKQAEERRAALEAFLAAECAPYEKALMAVREMYKARKLTVDPNGFLLNGKQRLNLSDLTKLELSPADSRMVYLCSSSGRNCCLKEMPAIAELPLAGSWIPACFGKIETWDLGIILTTKTGIPVLLHMDSDGEFQIDEILMAKYIEALVSKTPVSWDVDEVVVPFSA